MRARPGRDGSQDLLGTSLDRSAIVNLLDMRLELDLMVPVSREVDTTV